MKVIKEGDYIIKRLDLISNDTDLQKGTLIEYFIDVFTPAGQKLKRVDIYQMPEDGIYDDKLEKQTNPNGTTTIIKYKAYKSYSEDVQYDHIEKDSDKFLGFPHKVIVEILPPDTGGVSSKVSDDID